MEVAEALKRRKVDVACIHEVKWKGKKAREIGMGYKLFYSGESKRQNGVGIILKDTLSENTLAVEGISDRVILLKLIIINSRQKLDVIPAHAPQSGLDIVEHDIFYQDLEGIVSRLDLINENIFLGTDLNGHLGTEKGEHQSHRGRGFGELNDLGERVLEFSDEWELIIANTYIDKCWKEVINRFFHN